MTEWYAFQSRDRKLERAADRIHEITGADAFCVVRKVKLRGNRYSEANGKRRETAIPILKPYIFAGFEETPNFFHIALRAPLLHPVRFAGEIQPVPSRSVRWIEHGLPDGYYRHYDATDAPRPVFRPGDEVEFAGGSVPVIAVDGDHLLLRLQIFNSVRDVPIHIDAAQLAMTRVA